LLLNLVAKDNAPSVRKSFSVADEAAL